jgi:hypothetical protein
LAVIVLGLFGPVTGLPVPDGRPVVLVFLDADCPLANRSAPQLGKFLGRVAVLGVMENGGDAAAFVRKHDLPYSVIPDPNAGIATRVRAVRTPEVVLLDTSRHVRYRGRVDDLADAVADVLAGNPVRVPVTKAAGCLIDRPRAVRDESITYARDVAAILDRRCVGCHTAGGIGPFPLTSFGEARRKAATVAEVVADGRMPPWHASPDHGRFRNDPRLTAAEKRTVATWVAAGCPEGDPKYRPPPPPAHTGWAIGTPDHIVQFPKLFDIPATGEMPYQHVLVDPGFASDVWVKGIEFRPGNRKVVHHCNVFLHPPDAPESTDLFETGPLGSSNLLAFTPGCGPGRYPDGTAKRIPAGWKIHFVIQYTATGKPEHDQSELGLVFADPATVRKEVATKLIATEDFTIPPGVAAHRVEQSWTADRDVLALAFFPHVHLRGKSFRYAAEYPDGSREILLDVPAYDFHWQHRYELAEPKRLPAGTVVRCTAVYDNSAENPANPNPAAAVKSGLRSEDEMFNGFLDVVDANEDLVPEPAVRRNWRLGGGLAALTCLGLLVRRFIRR